MQANGTFVVDLQPLEPHARGVSGVNLGRMSIDKVFAGDLQATSRGEMLTAMHGEGAGYVALEQVSGSLGDKEGTLVLQHYGVSGGGGDSLLLEVLPGSGTGDFAGLTGKMTIRLKDGKHVYSLEYSLEG